MPEREFSQAPALMLARGMSRDPGFVWLDSAGHPGISILGSRPDYVLEGKHGDWDRLEQELGRRSCGEGTLAEGAAIGYFRFDGSYRFGFYDTLNLIGHEESPSPIPPAPGVPIAFRPEITRDDYLAMVGRAKEYIAAGDIYQVCLAHRFSAPFADDPWPLYLALRATSPAPHAAYLRLGDECVLSSSPECFLRLKGRRIVTRPVKGTRPRGDSPQEDARLEAELRSSAKESAELLMITDLERNDLGRVCDFGSVGVTRLLELERHAQVFHLVSTVEGTLREGCSHVGAIAACFPGGSISGAPKKRALEIIAELESTPRGLFTGAIGYFGFNGESQFNIAIRTIVVREGLAEFHAGAGITADSVPEQEWEETLHKAAGILKASSPSV